MFFISLLEVLPVPKIVFPGGEKDLIKDHLRMEFRPVAPVQPRAARPAESNPTISLCFSSQSLRNTDLRLFRMVRG